MHPLFLLAAVACAQPDSPLTPPFNGPRKAEPSWVALADLTIHIDHERTLHHASIIFRDGAITAILNADPGPDAKPGTPDDTPARLPLGPRVIDCSGLHAYPAFIEPYFELDAPAPAAGPEARHWNAGVTPERSALDGVANLKDPAEALRKLGFAAAAVSPKGGTIRGSGALVSLAKPHDDAALPRPPVYRDHVFQTFSLDSSFRAYPSSQMGAIALIRQTLADADRQAAMRRHALLTGPATCLDFLAPAPGVVPVATLALFDCADELESLRALKLAKEFSRPVALVGSGAEYKRLAALAERLAGAGPDRSAAPLLIPLNFPPAPDVSSLAKAEQTDLRELMAWEQAPTNPARLHAAGLRIAFTSHRLKNRADLIPNLRRAIAHGLPEPVALQALTSTPASILGAADQLGTLDPGKRANILLADGPIFARKTKLRDLFIDGQRHALNPKPIKLEGTWDMDLANAPPATRSLVFDDANALTIHRNDASVKAAKSDAQPAGPNTARLAFVFDHEPLDGQKGLFTASAVADLAADPPIMRGTILRPSGDRSDFTARRRAIEKPHPALGQWRVIEADNKPRDPFDDSDGLLIDLKKDKLKLTFFQKDKDPIVIESKDVALKDANAAEFSEDLTKLGVPGICRDAATIDQGPSADPDDDILVAVGTMPDGSTHSYRARRAPDDDERADHDLAQRVKDIPKDLGLPFGPYALATTPPQERVALQGATVWTNTGTPIERATVVIDSGRVAEVLTGRHEPVANARAIDCAGKHLTPGIIDAHSHTGISKGVNEGGQAVTAECRIADVTDPDAISWYRQLAGGVTSVLSLHGSANAIGGQSQTNKIRWGCAHPDDMHFENAIPGIKFALGENPRQANRTTESDRYPQTRMGVEMLIRDRFTAAREHARAHAAHLLSSGPPRVPPRRDLELEALAEVLAGQRLVHCHSYRQDEMVMLALVAKDFGFTIGTYQHALEGYKIADFVREHSGGASGFSDWWGYKIEVQDAIPHAFPIMWEQGVVTSFNSDSDELARRMNVEAAKATKYAGVPPEEALKFVTLFPAKQLKIDDRVGSIEPGRHADLALWSGPPMSPFSRCEMTFVDGRRLFSLDDDAAHRASIAAERQRLIQKILAENAKKASRKRPAKSDAKPDDKPDNAQPDKPDSDQSKPSADQLALERHFLDLLARNKSIDANHAGDCGCAILDLR